MMMEEQEGRLQGVLKTALDWTKVAVITIVTLGVVFVGSLFVLAWLADVSPDHFICKGTHKTIFSEQTTSYPNAQLGIELFEPNWIGRTVFGQEPRYDYSLHGLPPTADGSVSRESDIGLAFIEFGGSIFGDEDDDIGGRTALYLNKRNGYVGLSKLKEGEDYSVGFNFDGFCEGA